MQRARPFRLSLARLGILLLAWHALVLQGLLAGPMAARAADMSAHGIELCLTGDSATPLPSKTPLHGNALCDCIAHCSGVSSAAPPAALAQAVLVRHEAVVTFAPAHAGGLLPTLRFHATARGPPMMSSASI